MIKRISLLFYILMFIVSGLQSQDLEVPEVVITKRKTKYVLLPATAYSPETGVTAGFLSAMFFDLAKGDTLTRMSQIALLGVITTKSQISVGTDFTIFTPKEKYRIEGRAEYQRNVDRNFGRGNNANGLVQKIDPETGAVKDEFNFLEFTSNQIDFRLSGMYRFKDGLFGGPAYHLNSASKVEPFGNRIVVGNNALINETQIEARLSGVGFGITYDTRDNLNNAKSGYFTQMRHLFYDDVFGSTHSFYNLYLDHRFYKRIYKEQSAAFRILSDQRFSKKDLPLYGLSSIGGNDFVRGYFNGTYRNNHVLGFETEYRIPLQQDPTAKFWVFWKRLAIHLFASGAQVMDTWQDFDLTAFRATIGFGGRYVVNFNQRINLRFDVGYGLHKGATANGRAWGVYFFLGEAF